jgi:hypothetical protein
LIDEGHKACLPEALDRALKVIRRPTADGDDVVTSIRLVLDYGTEDQHRQLAALAAGFEDTILPTTRALQYRKLKKWFKIKRAQKVGA